MMEGATIPAGEGLISYYTQYPQFGQFRNGERVRGRGEGWKKRKRRLMVRR